MAVDDRAAGTRVRLTATLARVRMPAGAAAALAAGDRIDIEPDAGLEPAVRLMLGGTTVALASVEESGGRLIAKIIRLGDEPAGRKLEQWRFTTNNPTTPD